MVSLPQRNACLSDSKKHILVFDVGGSHIAGALFHPHSLELGRVSQTDAPVDDNPCDVYARFEALARQTLGEGSWPTGVAVAIPNPFDYERGISYMRHKYQLLYATDLRRGLSDHLRCAPQDIHFLNDAAACLVGEIHRGAAIGANRVVGLTLGTGVGSAFAVNGKIVVDGAGVPPGGEIWNLLYENGTVEDVISTRAIQQRYVQLTGRHAEVHDIASTAMDHLAMDNSAARKTFEDFGKDLGEVLQLTCLSFRPERIILGGGISRAASLFQRAAKEAFCEPAIELSVSELFQSAALIGAGVSWMQRNDPEQVASRRVANDVVSPLQVR
jgi:glucokinase